MSKVRGTELLAAVKKYDPTKPRVVIVEDTHEELRAKFEAAQDAFHAKGKEIGEKNLADGKVKFDFHTYNYSRNTQEFRINLQGFLQIKSPEMQKLQTEMEAARDALQAEYRRQASQNKKRAGRSLEEVQKDIDGWKADVEAHEAAGGVKSSYNVPVDVARELGIL